MRNQTKCLSLGLAAFLLFMLIVPAGAGNIRSPYGGIGHPTYAGQRQPICPSYSAFPQQVSRPMAVEMTPSVACPTPAVRQTPDVELPAAEDTGEMAPGAKSDLP